MKLFDVIAGYFGFVGALLTACTVTKIYLSKPKVCDYEYHYLFYQSPCPNCGKKS